MKFNVKFLQNETLSRKPDNSGESKNIFLPSIANFKCTPSD